MRHKSRTQDSPALAAMPTPPLAPLHPTPLNSLPGIHAFFRRRDFQTELAKVAGGAKRRDAIMPQGCYGTVLRFSLHQYFTSFMANVTFTVYPLPNKDFGEEELLVVPLHARHLLRLCSRMQFQEAKAEEGGIIVHILFPAIRGPWAMQMRKSEFRRMGQAAADKQGDPELKGANFHEFREERASKWCSSTWRDGRGGGGWGGSGAVVVVIFHPQRADCCLRNSSTPSATATQGTIITVQGSS